MKRLLSVVVFGAFALTANQALALVSVTNSTAHKIEVWRISQIFMHHYRVTVDGKQCLDGTNASRSQYRLKSTIKTVHFDTSALCVGSADHEVIEAIVTDKDDNVEILCIDNGNNPTHSYRVYSMRGLH